MGSGPEVHCMYTLRPEVRGTALVCVPVPKAQQQQLAPQRVNPALAVAVGRMFHTAAVTQ